MRNLHARKVRRDARRQWALAHYSASLIDIHEAGGDAHWAHENAKALLPIFDDIAEQYGPELADAHFRAWRAMVMLDLWDHPNREQYYAIMLCTIADGLDCPAVRSFADIALTKAFLQRTGRPGRPHTRKRFEREIFIRALWLARDAEGVKAESTLEEIMHDFDVSRATALRMKPASTTERVCETS